MSYDSDQAMLRSIEKLRKRASVIHKEFPGDMMDYDGMSAGFVALRDALIMEGIADELEAALPPSAKGEK